MRMLLLTALLLASAGAVRADAAAPPAKAGKPAKAQKAGAPAKSGKAPEKDAKAGPAAKGDAAPKPAEKPADNKPCEPVKPCPIE